MDVLFVNDDELLEKYYDIWNKVSKSIKKEVHCEPVYNNKFLKIKIRCFGHEATDFH